MAGLVSIVIGQVILRLIGIANYPLPHPDEGFWCLGPKNWILFGDTLMDGRLHPFLSPMIFVLLSCLFLLVDPSLFNVRLFSSFVGLLTVGIVFLLGRSIFSKRYWIWPFLFGTCSFFILDNRRMLVETLAMLIPNVRTSRMKTE